MADNVPKFDETEEIEDVPSFEDTEPISFEDTVPMGGEMGLSDVITQTQAEDPLPELPQEVSQGRAASLGAQQGLTMGFSDEIGAGAQSTMDRLQRLLNEYTGLVKKSPTQVSEDLAMQGATGDVGATDSDELYQEEVDRQRAELQAADDQHPWTYGAADIAGSALIPLGAIAGATAKTVKGGAQAVKGLAKTGKVEKGMEAVSKGIAPVGKALDKAADVASAAGKAGKAGAGVVDDVAQAAGGLSKIQKGALGGAAVGATEAAGRTEEDLLSAEGLTDIATGAAFGGVLGGVGGKLSKKVDPDEMSKAAKTLEKEANITAIPGMGGKAKDVADIIGTKTNKAATMESAKDVGKTVMDEGVFKINQTADELKTAIVDKMDEVASQRMAPAAQQADALTKDMPIESFTDELTTFRDKVTANLDDVLEKSRYAKQDDQLLYGDMQKTGEKVLEDLEAALGSPNKITELTNIKRKLQSQVNWNNPEATPYNEFLVGMQRHISELTNGMAAKGSPEVAEQLAGANKVYADLTIANRIAGDELARDAVRNSGIGWKDYFLGGAISGITGNKYLGAGAVAVKKGIESATGTPMGKMAQKMESLSKFKKAKRLAAAAENPGPLREAISKAPGLSGASAAATGSSTVAAMSSDDKVIPTYKRNQIAAKIIEKATPEMFMEQANVMREQYGQEGERLAAILERMASKDKAGKNALMFSLMQNAKYMDMLVPGVKKSEVDEENEKLVNRIK